MQSRTRVPLTVGIVATSLFVANVASADGYLNCATTEAALNADPNTLMCDDFEVAGVAGGNWYGEDCDTANNAGGIVARTKGWCGSIFANPITPAGAFTCGGVGVGGVGCTANHGALTGGGEGRNMADHDFVGKAKVTELFVRYYQKWLTGYQFGAEKNLTFNEVAGSGGIKWGNLHINCGTGGATSQGALQWQPVGGGFSQCFDIAPLDSGVWYAIQVHVRLSTTQSSNDGLLQAWVDDCGASGTACSGAPTMRLDKSNMSFDRSDANQKLGSLWWENWANPGSTGTSYVDQIVVSKSGPIGFIGASATPPLGDAGAAGGGSSGSVDAGSASGDSGASKIPTAASDDASGCHLGRGVSDGVTAGILLLGVALLRRTKRR